jgi:hypothetical protein
MRKQRFSALQERHTHRSTLRAELDDVLAQIRALQRRRCQIEKEMRQAQRVLAEWWESEERGQAA